MALPRFVTCLLVAIVLASSAVLSGQSLKTVIPPSMNDRWMTEIARQYPAYKDQMLSKTLLPGTHDSGAYRPLSFFFSTDLIGLLVAEWLTLGTIAPGIIPQIHNWSVTQSGNFRSQLEGGVRFFDIRLCVPDVPTASAETIRLCHGFYGETLANVLGQVDAFLAGPGRSKEIVILQFSRLHEEPKADSTDAFKTAHAKYHATVSQIIQDKLGNRLASPNLVTTLPDDCAVGARCLAAQTLDDIWATGKQVIVTYPYDNGTDPNFKRTNLWNGGSNKNYWTDYDASRNAYTIAARVSARLAKTECNWDAYHERCFQGVQLQGTPPSDASFVGVMMGGPGLEELASRTNPITVQSVINENHPNLNIVLTDFTVESGLVEGLKELTIARLEKNATTQTTSRAYLSRTVPAMQQNLTLAPTLLQTSWNGTYFVAPQSIRNGLSSIKGEAALTTFAPSGGDTRLFAGGLRFTGIDDDFLRTSRTWNDGGTGFDVDLGETSYPVPITDIHDLDRDSANFATAFGKFYVAWTGPEGERKLHFASSTDAVSFDHRITIDEQAFSTPALAAHRNSLYIAWMAPDMNSISYGRILADNSFEKLQTIDLTVQGAWLSMTGFRDDLFFAWIDANFRVNVFRVNLNTKVYSGGPLHDWSYANPSVAVFKGSVYVAYTGTNGRQYTLRIRDGLTYSEDDRVVQDAPMAYVLTRPVLHAWGDRASVKVTSIKSMGLDYTPGQLAPGDVIVTFECEAPVAGIHGFLTGATFTEGETVSVTVTPGPFPAPQSASTNCVDLAGLMVPASVGNIRFASTRISPQINWPAPADIVYGTPLSTLQRTAVAVKPGTGEEIPGLYSYNYPVGAVLKGGGGQVLRVTFTPFDTLSYYSNTREVVINVMRKPVTITATAAEKVYGNGDPILTGTSSGFRPEDNITPVFSRTPGEHVAGGPYTITASLNGVPGDPHNNYDVTVVPAEFRITRRPIGVAADPKSKRYGDADPQLTHRVTSGSLVPGDGFTGSLGRNAGEAVGTHVIDQGSLTLSDNYAMAFSGNLLTITARSITVAADAKSKTYGDADPQLTHQITSGSLVAGDGFTGALSRAVGEAAGTHAINQGSLTLGNNYAMTFTGSLLTITARSIAVAADAKSKTYGDPDPQLTHQVTSGSLVAGDGFTGSLSRAVGEAAGTHAINQGSLTLGNNYAITFTGNLLTITARPIAVTADAKSKIYGTADPQLTYKVTSGNLVFSDAFAGGLSRAAGENVGPYAINQGTLTAGENYALTYNGANLAIDAAPTATALTSTPSPSTYGQTITLTATVSRTIPAVVAGTATPAGTVTFKDGGQVIGVGSLVNGIATLSIGSLGAGAHAITLDYSPAAPGNFTASNAAGTHAVDKSRTSAVLTSSLNPAATGAAVTFTASVTAVAPGAGIPTGTITFMNGNTVLGSAAVNGSGQATLTTSSLAVGMHQITATYGGDANFLSAPPAAFSQLVYAFANSAGGTFVIGDLNAAVGANVTFWSAQWHSLNTLSGASAPSSFKGFAVSPAQAGGTWTTGPGNSANPPASLPAYMAVIVSSSITKSGSTIGGNIGRLVVVQTNPGYGANPGHAGTGTVIASVP